MIDGRAGLDRSIKIEVRIGTEELGWIWTGALKSTHGRIAPEGEKEQGEGADRRKGRD